MAAGVAPFERGTGDGAMKVIETAIAGVLIIEPDVRGDTRGFFLELFQEERYARSGIGHRYVQDNLSRSARGVLRGLRYEPA
jgi:dTDP-4-dehydrorhamnose 3,5-epimerase